MFRIVNEQTRQPVEDPAAKVLRLGTVVGLANHTALLARDGREVPIDDCGAPIIDDRGAMAGVVLVFRDVTQRRQAEEAEVLRRANERMGLAVRGSNVGVWDIEMPDGDYHHGCRHYMNIWEQFGYERPRGLAERLGGAAADDRDVSRGRPRPRGRRGKPPPCSPMTVAASRKPSAVPGRETGTNGSPLPLPGRILPHDACPRCRGARRCGQADPLHRHLLDITKLKLTEQALRAERTTLAEPDREPAAARLVRDAGRRTCALLSALEWTLGNRPATAGRTRSSSRSCFTRRTASATRRFEIGRRWRGTTTWNTGCARRDGANRWISHAARCHTRRGREHRRMFGTSTDITDLRRTEEALRESERAVRGTVRGRRRLVFVRDDRTGRSGRQRRAVREPRIHPATNCSA